MLTEVKLQEICRRLQPHFEMRFLRKHKGEVMREFERVAALADEQLLHELYEAWKSFRAEVTEVASLDDFTVPLSRLHVLRFTAARRGLLDATEHEELFELMSREFLQ